MDDNKKFTIRQYREALYKDILARKKAQRKKQQEVFLEKLGVKTEAQNAKPAQY